MKLDKFNRAIAILATENTGSPSEIQVSNEERGIKRAEPNMHLTIIDSNAAVVDRLIAEGYSLFPSKNGVRVDHFK